MKDLLATYYDIQVDEKIVLNQLNGYRSGEYFYFTMLANNKEAIHMEQAALAYYLAENNYPHMAIPIPTVNGDWFTTHKGKNYLLLRVNEWNRERTPHGKKLAAFHQTGVMYRYEPQEISSYGQWKQLWIDKITAYENKIVQDAKESPNDYHRLMMDILPYIIGISENAIQYMQETESEHRFDEGDQGTISFRRYADQLQNPVLWVNDLVYDHPARDLAEYVRFNYLLHEGHSVQEMVSFMNDYQAVRSLSVFSWRLIYARLLFPVHLIDLLERGFVNHQYDQLYPELSELLAKQPEYEKKMANFFELMGIDCEALQIPVLHWL